MLTWRILNGDDDVTLAIGASMNATLAYPSKVFPYLRALQTFLSEINLGKTK